MLTSLSIRDIVLIEKLDLDFEAGLSVLTGETGAGKSILLDSLSLATGARSDRTLVRESAEFGRVTATFELDDDHPACAFARSEGLETDGGTLILKRQLSPDGRSRAWVNGEPVSRAAMASLGAHLVEIHGQNDDRNLLDSGAHRALLDGFGGYTDLLAAVQQAYGALKAARSNLKTAEDTLATARRDEDYLRHSVDELRKLAPQVGEEDELSAQRTRMMHGEKMASDLSDWRLELSDGSGVDAVVRGVLRRMERQDTAILEQLKPIIESLDRAAIELSEGLEALDRLAHDLEYDPKLLEDTEARLFELRRLARKHSTDCDSLSALASDLTAKLEALDAGDAHVTACRAALSAAEEVYKSHAAKLTLARTKAASAMDAAVNAELAPLKLEKAVFRTHISALGEGGEQGADHVEFEVKTNPSTPFGPLTKIASGGETARFILALKVVLAARSTVPVMVFDEVDRGIGGATAAAVGERLERLAVGAQVLVVTHSPQVAARGNTHFQISKSDDGAITRTSVDVLSADERLEEVARMLAGAEITEEARAAARSLLGASADL